ncbi:MAG: glutamate--tRNA ligase [Candidatus Vogelbacteria bacterium]|nr:glutamate--tRNA ligase [Candidatus Vogelbacteria bacterium]
METSTITRFAPSPTGFFHVGSARTALFNFLVARQFGGTFILRIEDTDRERSKAEYEADILKGLLLLGLTADEMYRQSERIQLYRSYLEKLLVSGAAYVSKEVQREANERSEVIRFRNPASVITFHDIIRGDITVDTTDLGDFIIAKDLDTPLYHFAVVVDDFESRISHVIRGEDHIANTPRQILIQQAIGAPRPAYAHLPLILARDRSKLSKRHGAVAVSDYLQEGYLPTAFINFLALLGWSPQHAGDSDESEILFLPQLIERFRLEHVQRSGGIFDIERLRYLNREHMRHINPEELAARIAESLPLEIRQLPDYSTERVHAITPLILQHISSFGELASMAEDLAYFFSPPKYEKGLLLGKNGELDEQAVYKSLSRSRELLESITAESFTDSAVKSALWGFATEQGKSLVLWPLRAALSGRERSPDPFTLAGILGKIETLARISHAEKLF